MRYLYLLFFFFLITGTTIIHAQDSIRLEVNKYDAQNAEQDSTWVMMKVKSDNLTTYSLVEDHSGNQIIKAESNNAAGGLIYKTHIAPHQYPIIEWRWKVDSIMPKGDLRKKEGDDYPARIYITFDYDKSNLSFGDRMKYSAVKTFTSYKVPLRALNYIWSNRAEKGTIAPNPFTDWVYMVAIQSGGKKNRRMDCRNTKHFRRLQKSFWRKSA